MLLLYLYLYLHLYLYLSISIIYLIRGAVICCACAISGDNMQDLKTGALVGSTPFKLQIMQLVGLVGPALTLSPVISLLIDAYGIGEPTLQHENPLPAPQASLMKAVAYSIFFGGKEIIL